MDSLLVWNAPSRRRRLIKTKERNTNCKLWLVLLEKQQDVEIEMNGDKGKIFLV